ncbi:MAG: hypothetical protein ACI8ZM_000321 [Crocinitomix sp.]|jgi:hypothetical protein
MKIWHLFLILISFSAKGQFEYEDISSYRSLRNMIEYEGSLYGVSLNSGTIVEVNLDGDEIHTYNQMEGFPLGDPIGFYLIDSILIILNDDRNRPENRGILSLNLNSKTHDFLPLEEILSHYVNDYNLDGNHEVDYESTCADEESVYMAIDGTPFDQYVVMSYNPMFGFDSLDVSGLPHLSHSMMIYAIYNGDELLYSGRIFFL